MRDAVHLFFFHWHMLFAQGSFFFAHGVVEKERKLVAKKPSRGRSMDGLSELVHHSHTQWLLVSRSGGSMECAQTVMGKAGKVLLSSCPTRQQASFSKGPVPRYSKGPHLPWIVNAGEAGIRIHRSNRGAPRQRGSWESHLQDFLCEDPCYHPRCIGLQLPSENGA